MTTFLKITTYTVELSLVDSSWLFYPVTAVKSAGYCQFENNSNKTNMGGFAGQMTGYLPWQPWHDYTLSVVNNLMYGLQWSVTEGCMEKGPK